LPPLSRARLWGFRLFSATALPLLVLAALEGALRLVGVGSPTSFTIPCEVRGRPAFCENPEFTAPFFPPGMARRPPSFVILAEKRLGTQRVFIVGESAALGDPEPTFAFSRFLEAMTRERFPEWRLEVINAGVVAINSHMLVPIVRDLARHDPDLFVIYAGNNEVVGPYGNGTVFTSGAPGLRMIRASIWLRSTRLGQLIASLGDRGGRREWAGMEMFLGHQVHADDPTLAAVYGNFQTNLKEMIEAARGSGAGVLVSTVGTRLRDFAPFASAHRAGLRPEELATFEAHLARGAEQESAGRWAEAQREYQAAAAIDGQFAELHYRLGRCALSLGDAAKAREHLVRARDRDTLRFRADSRINQIIRETAAASGALLVDGEAALGELPGGELFYEHAHPTPEGNYRIASALFAALEPGAAAPGEESCQRRLALTGFDRYRVAKEVLRRLSRPPFTGQVDHAAQVAALERERDRAATEEFDTSDATYRAALALNDDDPWLHYNHAILLDTRDVFLARRGAKDPTRAIPQYQLVLERLPQFTDARYRLVEALLRAGRFDDAIAQCHELLRFRPRYALAYRAMSQALAAKGRTDEARAAYDRAIALDPSLAGN
jgi:tetratricopeptide (TPR) repeat protein